MSDEPRPAGADLPSARADTAEPSDSGDPPTAHDSEQAVDAPATTEAPTDDANAAVDGDAPEPWLPQKLLFTLIVFYGVFSMIALGIRWLRFGTPLYTGDLQLDTLIGPLQWTEPGLIWALTLALLIALAGIAMQPSMARSGWGRELAGTVRLMMGNRPTFPLALACGLTSGIGEELLFRGALQPALGDLGWLWATLIFAALHAFNVRASDSPERAKEVAALPLLRRLWVRHGWGVFALCFGFLLAGLYEWSQSLWPPMLTHILLNSVNIYRIARAKDEPA